MNPGGYVGVRASQKGQGTLLNTYTTAKSVINQDGLCTYAANELYVGKMIRIRAQGNISNVVTSQRTFTFQTMFGPTANIIVLNSGAILTTTAAHTTIPFDYEVLLKCDSVGSGTTAKFTAQGILRGIMFVISGAVADPTAGIGTIMCPNTVITPTTGFDSTVANVLDFWVGLSASESTTGIQIMHYMVEDLN